MVESDTTGLTYQAFNFLILRGDYMNINSLIIYLD